MIAIIPATDPWSVAEEVKPSTVSTAQLHPSPDFHMRPIKQVVFQGTFEQLLNET